MDTTSRAGPGSGIALGVAGLYLLVALLALLLPVLTTYDLAGVWAILLALPWSALFPMGVAGGAAPGLVGGGQLLLMLCAMLLNAALLYVGIRWAGRWSAARRDGLDSRDSTTGAESGP